MTDMERDELAKMKGEARAGQAKRKAASALVRANSALDDHIFLLTPDDDVLTSKTLTGLRRFLRETIGTTVAGICATTIQSVDDTPRLYWTGQWWEAWTNDRANYPKLFSSHVALYRRCAQVAREGFKARPAVWIHANHFDKKLGKYLNRRHLFPGCPRGLSR